MVSTFNLEALQSLLSDFYRITQIRITVFDDQFQELVSFPEERPPFCQQIRSCADGSRACAECDQSACRIAAKQDKAYIYRCHAGLTEAIMPLYAGSALVGYLLFGHLFAYDSFEDGWNQIQQCCTVYPLDMEKLKEACRNHPKISESYIKSAAHILHATASYLILERMAFLQSDSTASRLDRYISDHFTQPLNSQVICRELGIGRTRLYKLSSQLYGVGPSEHIRNLRISKAKELLSTDPDMSISDVGLACGFEDYNYFISVFTKETGISPGKYKKAQ